MARNYSLPTIKTLFAEAVACAYPDCGEPLIFHDRGAATVVCQIAHIRSESTSGPRHDPAYPDYLLDEAENLLLLCGRHHPPVDRHESLYTTDELLAWKANQVAQAAGTGTPISDSDARQFARLSDEERQALAEIARRARRVEDAASAVQASVQAEDEQRAASLRKMQRRMGPMWEVDDEGNRGEEISGRIEMSVSEARVWDHNRRAVVEGGQRAVNDAAGQVREELAVLEMMSGGSLRPACDAVAEALVILTESIGTGDAEAALTSLRGSVTDLWRAANGDGPT